MTPTFARPSITPSTPSSPERNALVTAARNDAASRFQHPQTCAYWSQLDCGFAQVANVFEECLYEALATLSRQGVEAYVDSARTLGKLGRGVEPILAFLEAWPAAAVAVGEEALPAAMHLVQAIQKSPNGKAIAPFMQTLAPVARRLPSPDQFDHYLDIARDLMVRTTGSIHGHHQTFPSPGLPDFFAQAPFLLGQLAIAGLKNWVEYGIRNYLRHPQRQQEYFSLKLADSRAVLQRERHGTLFVDAERRLDLYMWALWRDHEQLVPYSTAFDDIRKPVPYCDKLGLRVPDVYDDAHGPLGTVSGLDRYRATLAHMVGHRRWTKPVIADNYSPFQRLAIETFEDCRVDNLLGLEYPGLTRILLALHPQPKEDACNPETQSCLRHRLAMLSRALLDPQHGYRDPDLREFVDRFHVALANREATTRCFADLAIDYVARTRRQSDQYANIHFDDSVVDYRDDNRQMWSFIEEGDEEESFDHARRHKTQEADRLPPRHYPEWDYTSQTYRPDWVSVYESLHPKGNAADIDRLLLKHEALAKRLKRLLDLLKPQDKVRIRYQEEGSELDLDVALRSLIDFRSGATPDPRINMSHQTAGRDVAVLLLLDLSESLGAKAAGSDQTILELSQEAVSLLAWAIDRLGDPFAIGGFHSNTRHDVRYYHIKGFSEGWSDDVKARLAAMNASFSTRMGAAMRHAAHTLGARRADKKLMLVLTDGEPSDVDAPDGRLLIEDARQAVRELGRDGIFAYCISLDPKADEYVADIFGHHFSVIDNIQRLPEKLPELFMALTK
ncbi:MAG: nitric oxide reductase activation protein NorD [Betaproteobacteria bacterium]|nr:nitric oxide reductase activation protein NorD [Betaproteobacteria bacterium]